MTNPILIFVTLVIIYASFAATLYFTFISINKLIDKLFPSWSFNNINSSICISLFTALIIGAIELGSITMFLDAYFPLQKHATVIYIQK